MLVSPDEDFLIAGLEGGPFFPESKVYLITNASEETLHWSASATHSATGFSASSGTLGAGQSEIVTVLVNTATLQGLPAGRYRGSITFANETTGEEEEAGLLLTISAGGALEVSPSIGFASTGPVGGPFQPLSAPYVLSNSGSSAIDWSVESSETWLSATVSSGQLQPGGTQGLTLVIDPAQAGQLSAGTHVASVVFHDLSNGSDLELVVPLEITEPARLEISPTSAFTTSGPPGGPFTPASQTYTLTNVGSELLDWQLTEDVSWVTLSSAAGSLAPAQQTTVVVGIDSAATNSLPDGNYSATLRFVNATNGLGDSTRTVTLTLSSTPAALTLDQSQGFSSSGPVGGPFQPSSKTYTLNNTGDQPLNWQASAPVGWLALSLTGGTLPPSGSAEVTVSMQQVVTAGMASGNYASQINFTNLTNGTGTTSRSANLSITTNGGAGPVLPPGSGFTGPTQEPGQTGSGTAKCIARWDVVPYQTIVEATSPTFTVGVVAFHIAGIERVSFSLEGGPWIDVTTMALNPRTGVWEYFATIDTSTFATGGPIEVRAIAYPKTIAPIPEGTGGYPGGGYPRLLNSLPLYVDVGTPNPTLVAYCSSANGSDTLGTGTAANPYATPWKAAQKIHADGGGSADGGIVYMGAGNYTWEQAGGGPIPSTSNRWLTFEPWPGTSADAVNITAGNYPGLGISLVRMHSITLRWWMSGDGNDQTWFDNCVCIGPGPGQQYNWVHWLYGFEHSYWTDVQARDCLAGLPGSPDLARNVSLQRVTYGPNRPKLVVNCHWQDLGAYGSSAHPDFIHWNFGGSDATIENGIVYGVTGANIGGIGIFYKDTGHLRDIALVNIAYQGSGPFGSNVGQNCQTIDHFLMWNFTHLDAGFRWEMPQAGLKDISIRGCQFNYMLVNTSAGGDGVQDSWFHNNNFGVGYLSIAPGTNATIADPQLTNIFTPSASSPLRNRVATPLAPCDAAGVPRPSPSTIGAFE